jgi:transaldolase
MPDEISTLRLFVDSAEVTDWKKYLPTGIFYGVTTNPKLLAKSGIDFKVDQLRKLADSAFDLGANEIHIQVWGRETEKMIEIGRELGAIDQRVMVKVPINQKGILCARQLIAEGSTLTLTALHSAQQALIAVAIGARYAAPYLGRMIDGGLNGLEEVMAMNRIVKQMISPLRLLVASIRQSSDLVKLAEGGLTTFTLLPDLIDDLLENQLTDMAVDSFESAVQ